MTHDINYYVHPCYLLEWHEFVDELINSMLTVRRKIMCCIIKLKKRTHTHTFDFYAKKLKFLAERQNNI